MGRRIYDELKPVRSRQLAMRSLHGFAVGLLIASLAGIALGGWRLTGASVPVAAIAAVVAIGPVLGLIVGLVRRGSWYHAAMAVDSHYELKDRAKTALAFLSHRQPSAYHELQVGDAVEHLATVQPSAVVPYRIPRTVAAAVLAGAAALAIAVIPLASNKAKAGPSAPRPEVLEVHHQLVADLAQLDELIKEQHDEKLDGMLKELKQKVEELKEPGVDVKEALAKLSEMQAAIANQQAQYNTGLVDGQLQSLGEAMGAAESLEAAGSALQEAKFEQAAKELEKLENPELDKKEEKAVLEKLKQVAKAMGDAGLGQMGEAASNLAEGLEGHNNARIKSGAGKLAADTRAHAKRKSIGRMLSAQLERLGECKSQCNNNGGLKKLATKKSSSPSTNWGRTVAGNTDGEKTNLLAKRDLKEITGNPGDEGDSEMETTHSPEGRQQAARAYRDAYKKAVKQSEAVLDSEPIPLGHRQTIRKYFESIRPSNGDDSDENETK